MNLNYILLLQGLLIVNTLLFLIEFFLLLIILEKVIISQTTNFPLIKNLIILIIIIHKGEILLRIIKINNKRRISSIINKKINEKSSQYLNDFDLFRKQNNFLNKTNPNIIKKFNEEEQSIIKLNKSKTKNQNSKKSHKLLFNSEKSLNPSSNGGLDLAMTNYTNQQKNSNVNKKSGNNILSNVNSASSRINDTNNKSPFLNGVKMMSGINEFFYDFNSGNKNLNNNEQKTDISIQSLSDSKLMELAAKYANEEDNSSENYQMNNILHSKKKYKIK